MRAFTAEHRANISKANKGKVRSEELKQRMRKTSPRNRAVKCLETGLVYQSQSEASRRTGISNNMISRACKGELNTAGGYHWQIVEGE